MAEDLFGFELDGQRWYGDYMVLGKATDDNELLERLRDAFPALLQKLQGTKQALWEQRISLNLDSLQFIAHNTDGLGQTLAWKCKGGDMVDKL